MSNSGPGHQTDAVLRIAVPFPLVLKLLNMLDLGDEEQRAVLAEVADTLPQVILAGVEMTAGERRGEAL